MGKHPTPSTSESPLDLRAERTLTVKDAAFRLNKSEAAVRMWLRRGRLKGWQVGGTYRTVLVSEKSVEEVLMQTKRFGA
ncbi:MAG: helix-turn-helix domain-containing protein [Acidobacteria bacterium]|nr:helix-turn-helix domain-containing protein [Acidobacteriota bacterium]